LGHGDRRRLILWWVLAHCGLVHLTCQFPFDCDALNDEEVRGISPARRND
jgi:hypothetical protein